jgi:2-isopropylmalate synthase
VSKDKLIIFDTTMRDGEQSPGAAMSREDKLRIAKALERLKVDVIEAGFPASSPGDFAAVKGVAEIVKDSRVCALARTGDADIDRAGEALKPAAAPRIHTFIATSPLHMEKKLRMTPDQVVEAAVRAVKRARQFTDDVEFSAEDAGRSELDFLCRIFEAVIDAGATTINVPDTVGYNLPHVLGEKFRYLIENIPNSDKAALPWPIRWPPCWPAPGRWNAPSMASASGPATRRWKRSSWRCARARTCSPAMSASTRATCWPARSWWPPRRAFTCSRTRPSWV